MFVANHELEHFSLLLSTSVSLPLSELTQVDLGTKVKVNYPFIIASIPVLSYVEEIVPFDRDCSAGVVWRGFGNQALPVS